MPWQGHNDNLIDRFDVRAHLDIIPTISALVAEDPTHEERNLNYERYRIIAQNAFLAITEEKFLKQLHLEEQFGYTENEPKRKKPTGGAAIGFNYDDGTGSSTYVPPSMEDEGSGENSDSDLDVDLSINISKIDQAQAHEMNRHGRSFGMSSNDFYSFLTNDIEEAESFKQAKEEEHEKALFSGRKSRRERRAHREKRMANRKISPPCYAARESPTMKISELHEKSESRSTSPESRKITYITSFGGEEEPQAADRCSYAEKLKCASKSRKRRTARDDRLMMEIRQIYVRSPTQKRSSKHRPASIKRRSSSRTRRRRTYSHSSRSRSRHRSRSNSRSKSRRLRRSRSSRRWATSRHRSSSSNSSTSRSPIKRRRRRKASLQRARSRSSSRSRFSSTSSKSESRSKSSRSPSESSRTSNSTSASKSSAKSGSKSPVKATYLNPEKARSKSPVGIQKVEEPRPDEPQMTPMVQEVTPKVFPRYYGRKKSDQSSSSEIGDSDEAENHRKDASPLNTQSSSNNVKIGNPCTSIKGASATSISLAERLKRRRQALLAKQFNADKMEEQLKTEREKQEQQSREDEMREMALKSRKKYQGRRSAYDSDSPSSNSRSRSRSRSKSSSPKHRSSRRHRDRSRGRDREVSDRRSPRHRDQREEVTHRDERRRDGQREGHRARDPEYSDKTKTKALVDY